MSWPLSGNWNGATTRDLIDIMYSLTVALEERKNLAAVPLSFVFYKANGSVTATPTLSDLAGIPPNGVVMKFQIDLIRAYIENVFLFPDATIHWCKSRTDHTLWENFSDVLAAGSYGNSWIEVSSALDARVWLQMQEALNNLCWLKFDINPTRSIPVEESTSYSGVTSFLRGDDPELYSETAWDALALVENPLLTESVGFGNSIVRGSGIYSGIDYLTWTAALQKTTRAFDTSHVVGELLDSNVYFHMSYLFFYKGVSLKYRIEDSIAGIEYEFGTDYTSADPPEVISDSIRYTWNRGTTWPLFAATNEGLLLSVHDGLPADAPWDLSYYAEGSVSYEALGGSYLFEGAIQQPFAGDCFTDISAELTYG